MAHIEDASVGTVDEQRWREIVATNSARVMALFSSVPDTSSWGDKMTEVVPLCHPLSDRAAAWDGVWERLLDEGIVEALCTSTPRLETWGDTCIGHRIPLEEGDRAYAERSTSTHIVPIRILAAGASYILQNKEARSRREKKFLATVKDHWETLMRAFWVSPQKSLIPGERPCNERTIFLIFATVWIVDTPKDLTITVLFRMWFHSTDTRDTNDTLNTIANILWPFDMEGEIAVLFNYRERHPVPSHVMQSLMKAIPGQSPKRLLERILQQFSTHTLGDVFEISRFLMNIAKSCKADNLPDVAITLMKTLCRSHALFASTFSIVIDPGIVKATESSRTYTYLSMLLRFVDAMTDHVSTICATESERYLQICRKTRMFDAFERALDNAHLSPDVIRSVVASLMGLRTLLRDNPRLISILRSEFPPPRILYGLLHVTFGVPHPDTLSWFVRTPSMRQPILMAWLQGYWALYALCEVNGDCMRRGCKFRSRKRCKACKWTKYCGEYCQKEDWEEHKLICGLAFNERAHVFPFKPHRLPFSITKTL